MKISNYPKIWNVGHPETARLFDGKVTIQEKVDGSQFSFMKDEDGVVYYRSKGSARFAGEGGLFASAINEVEDMKDLLNPGWVYRCETLCRPKHNCLTYGRIPNKSIVLYDVQTGDSTFMLSSEIEAEALRLGVDPIRTFHHRTRITSVDDVMALMEEESFLGGCKIEGLVFKTYDKFNLTDGKVLMGKYVSEAFKERNSSNWKKANPSKTDILVAIGESLRTEARWNKAIAHAREEGALTHSPKDIGPLIKLIQQDIEEEEKEAIKEQLWKEFRRLFMGKASHGFPEYYKKLLLDRQFDDSVL